MHSLICGVTESGKTTLAKAISSRLRKKGHKVLVYDPVYSATHSRPWGNGCVIYTEPEIYFEALTHRRNFGSHLFIDESGELFSQSNRDRFWLLTRGRHLGYSVNLIAQRPKMIAPTVRTQCATAYVFRLAADDLDEVGRDFGHKLSHEVLDKGDYLILESGRAHYSRANVFKQTGVKPK